MRVLLTLLKIVALSAPLTWLWIEWGRDAYGRLFLELALPIYGLFGATTIVPEGARDRFINYLPFLILMLVTPRLSWRRRLWGTLIGFFVIFVSHLAFVYVASQGGSGRSITRDRFMRIVPANSLSDALPFVLWVLIARQWVWEQVSRIFPHPEGGASAAVEPGERESGERIP